MATSSSCQQDSKAEWGARTSFAVEEESCFPEEVNDATLTSVEAKTESTVAAVLVFGVNYNDDGIVGYGCSNHMTADKEKLVSMSEYKGGRAVVIANNSKLPFKKSLIVTRLRPQQV